MPLHTSPLHPAQQDVYLDQAINTAAPYYNMGGYIRLTGHLDKEKFIEAVRSAPEVFDALRMRFDLRDEEPLAYVDDAYRVFEISELEFPDGADKKERVEQWIRTKLATPFQVEKDTMLADHGLIRMSAEEHWYYFKYHHLIVDGYGISGVLQYIAKKYKSLVSGEPLTFNYPSYIEEAKRAAAIYASEEYAAEGEYWKKKISKLPSKLLQKKFKEEESMKNKCDTFILEFAGEERAVLEALQTATNANLQQLTIAAMMIYYGRTSGQEDFIFGIPLHRRRNKQLRTIAGMFTGVIPFAGSYKAGTRVSDLIKSVLSSQREDYRYQNYLIGDLSRHLNVRHDDDGMIEIAVNFAPVDFHLDLGEELSSVLTNIPSGYLPFPMEMFWYDYGKHQPLQLRIDYQVAYFNKEEISGLVQRLLLVLHQFRETPDALVEQISLLPAEERELLARFSSPAPYDPYGADNTLPALLSTQANATPLRNAVVHRNAALSYGKLEAQSNRLSHYLRSKGVNKDKLVPVCLERSMDMFVAILSTWKAGGAYVPIDITYPAERISYLLQDTAASLVICSRATSHLFAPGVETLLIDELPDAVTNAPGDVAAGSPAPQDLSYVIYTSGSTGKPKGVMVEHQGMLNHLYAKTGDLQINAETVLAFTASYTFDISVWQMFAALMYGGHTIVYDDDHIYQPAALINAVEEDKVTILELVPSYLAAVLQEKTTASLNNLQYLMVTGEAVSQHLLQQWFTHPLYGRIPVVNAYGPTEASDDITHHIMHDTPAGANVPLGRPVRNMNIYIVSKDLELCPSGVAGEICVAGVGVSRGYLGRPELTAEKFITNPFTAGGTWRMYRTGDLGRWLPDGTIEYLGRIDDQVKIRGYRIELGEIESVLHQLPQVSEAVVVAREDKGHKQLVAYIVTQNGFDRETALIHLKDQLPEYMIPVIVELEKMPLTPNGKVDKRALPDPLAESHSADTFVAPRNKTEQLLAEIWQELLRVEKVGIHDNFFELGGNSLLGIRMIAVISRAFDTQLTVRSLFRYATIATLATYIQQQDKRSRSQITAQPHITPKLLSFSQERLWFIDSMEGSEHYHIPVVLQLKGHPDSNALQYALQSVINRHEVLRTVIYEQDGTGYQQVLPQNSWQLEETADSGNTQQAINNFIYRPFDLTKDHMLRASLLKQSDNEHTLVITVHHIAADAWSMALILKEFAAYYNEAAAGLASGLPELPLQYADYAIWQRAYVSGEVLSAGQQYWKKKLTGIEPLNLPTDYPRPAIQSKKGAITTFSIGKEIAEKLQQLSRQQGTTLFVTLLSAFKVLLFRYTGQQDICIGTPVAGRRQEELESMIGFFVDTLPLYSKLDAGSSFNTLLQEVKELLLEGYEHQDLPFEKIVEAVSDNRDLSRTPLFQAMFVLQDAPEMADVQMNGLALSTGDIEHNISKFDITALVTQKQDELSFGLEYCTDLFSRDTIERMAGHFEQLLQSIVHDPAQSLERLQMLSAAEEQQLLKTFNDSAVPYPQDQHIIDRFDEQVTSIPEATALIFKNSTLSYRELDEHANRLGRYLRKQGVNKETRIPICIERSFEMIIGILGILKAGGVYVPIDPDYPEERINYILEDTGAAMVISSSACAHKLAGRPGINIISLDEEAPRINRFAATTPGVALSPSQLAYIIYTSGSTGKPKGVMLEHKGVVNLALGQATALRLRQGTRSLQFASFGFDASCYEIFNTLLSGGVLVLPQQEDLLSQERFTTLINAHAVELVTLPPSYQHIIKEHTGPIKTIVSAGEPLNREDGKYLQSKGIRLINAYGPTENTVCTTLTDNPIRKDSTVVIGTPIANVQVYILGPGGSLCPVGVSGEICIGGANLARGYWNRADLTAEKFIPNPYSKEWGSRLYRTGDLGRWLADGHIEYIGRMDDQVKIRGYRIELGEIESVLQDSPLVSQAAVLAKTGSADQQKQLVAYIVPQGAFNETLIREYLQQRLPEYMIPPLFIAMEQLPLTPSGKIDRKALPEPAESMRGLEAYVAPRSHTELLLVKIWQELLDKGQIGIRENFFHLGGHSLMAIRLIAAVRKELHSEISVRDVFTRNTIETLAVHIEQQQGKTVLPEILVQAKPPYIPLSFSQERLWFIDKLEGSVHYHISTLLKLKGKLNRHALQHALQHILERHEALRTVIREHGDSAYQQILPAGAWQLQELSSAADLSAYGSQPFDLASDYLLRAALIQSGSEAHELIITMHHIASDGWSVSILAAELSELYAAFTEERSPLLQPLAVQYTDYAIWQRTYVTGDVLQSQQNYWQKKLAGIEPLNLQTDHARPAVQRNNGALFISNIDRELTDKVNALSRQQGVTPFMTLLAALKVLLYRYSGQEDICVGTPLAGRKQQEVESLIGFFINTLAVRSDLGNNPGFDTFLQQLKNTLLEGYEHQDMPFEKVVDAVVRTRDLSRHPLFQVMFVLHNTPDIPVFTLNGLAVDVEEVEETTAKFDLVFTIQARGEELLLGVEYCTDLFLRETVADMVEHYKQLLLSVTANPAQQLGSLNMLTSAEKQTLQAFSTGPLIDLPADQTVVTLFEEQVQQYPDAVALQFEDERITYRELHERSNQLAHLLRSKGIGADSKVPVFINRCPEMIIAVLGIWKAGGAYVPVDPAFPEERVRYILEETEAHLVVTNQRSSLLLPADLTAGIVAANAEDVLSQPRSSLLPVAGQQHLAYVLYTSGSTGKPKGVLVEHAGLLNHLLAMIEEFSMSPSTILAFTAPYTFDISVWQMVNALVCGGRTVIYTDSHIHRPDLFIKTVEDDRVTLLQLVPSYLSAVLQEGPDVSLQSLEYLLVTGEAVSVSLLEQWFAHERFGAIPVVNAYGPTEASDDVSFYTMTKAPELVQVPVGKPIRNLRMYVLDNNGQLCPQGVPGEICVAGLAIARGYQKRPELTAEKFVEDPFYRGERMYRTGDLGRWLQDGNMEYIGRADDQVKIRGFRIELGEIEHTLQQYPQIAQAVVVARSDDKGIKRLVAYLVPQGELDKDTLTAYLKDRLPEYMIPVFVLLDKLPLTANGKIDKKALPDPAAGATTRYVAPRNPLESRLAGIWQRLLGVQQAGIYDNFFESGGHSLLVIRLIAAIRKEIGAELQVKDVFIYSDIASLAAVIDGKTTSLLPPVTRTVPKPALIPLSFGQERLWFIDRLEGSTHYHNPTILKLAGTVSREGITWALQQVINRHEVLRTVIRESDGTGYQYVLEPDSWEMDSIDTAAIAAFISKPFDLSRDHMLRAALISHSPDDHVLVIVVHHIAFDGWSDSIVIGELSEYYAAYTEKRDALLEPLALQYSDYAIWQRSYLEGPVLETSLQYWKQQLSGIDPLNIPTDYPRPLVQSKKGAMLSVRLDSSLAGTLNEFSKQEGVTLFMTLLAAFKVLLFRYTGQQDICLGTPIAGRRQQEIETLAGLFINTLALRSQPEGTLPFATYLQQVKTMLLEAYEHQDLPFERIVDAVVKNRDLSRSPLFQVMLVLQNTPEEAALKLGDATLTEEETQADTSKYDLIFVVEEKKDGLLLHVEYCTDLFSPATATQLAKHYEQLLKAATTTPATKLNLLTMLTPGDEQLLLNGFNGPAVAYPADKTIVTLFEEQAARTPELTAVVHNNQQLTYRQLDERSNQLAHYLRSKGVKEETLVPVCMEKGLDMIISMLAILKAGGAYVPVDPDYPEDRIQFMMEDTGALLAVSSSNDSAVLRSAGLAVIIETDSDPAIAAQPHTPLNTRPKPGNVAYVIYTSGSTGRPKGVLIEHVNVVRLFETETPLYDFDANDVWTMFHSFSFDFSVWEIYGALFYGGRVVIVPKEVARDVTRFGELLISEGVTVLNQTPSAFYVLQDYLSTRTENIAVRYVIFGGEALNPAKLRPWREQFPASRLINMYGITETTVHVTFLELDNNHLDSSASAIGKPIPTLNAYILDSEQQPVPVGVTGELYIGGAGVARGYLNRPELTAARFLASPFKKDERLYRSGDLARWYHDGNIEYQGRIDDQVKIRGFRIELGEIENAIQGSGFINNSVVLAKTTGTGDKQLVAYIVPGDHYSKEAVVAHLKGLLPEYMVPSLWVVMDTIPLTSNGKVNRKALPEPDAARLANVAYIAPRTNTERSLAGIWQELLGAERVGIHDNFFELGGDSIRVIKVSSRIYQLFHKEVKVFEIYQAATLEELAVLVDNKAATATYREVVYREVNENLDRQKESLLPLLEGTANIEDLYPVSDIERGMLFISLMNPGEALYHDQFVGRLPKTFDAALVRQAYELLAAKHSILRTGFRMGLNGQDIQIVYRSVQVDVPVFDLQHLSGHEVKAAVEQYLREERARPFVIEDAPLWRAALFSVKDHQLLVFQFHHAILDGWSVASLNTELYGLCAALLSNQTIDNLSLLRSSYKDYIIESLVTKKLDENRHFWSRELSEYKRLEIFNEEPVLQVLNYQFDEQYVALLKERVRKDHLSLKGLALGAYLYTLAQLTYEEDLTVGLVTNTRPLVEDADLLLGCFLNTIPLRYNIDNSSTWRSWFEGVEAKLLSLKERERTSLFEITKITGEHASNNNPYFDTIFNFINFHVYDKLKGGVGALTPDEAAELPAIEDYELTNTFLDCTVSTTGDTFTVQYSLRRKLRAGKTLDDLLYYFRKIINAYLEHYDEPLTATDLLSQEESRLVLETFPASPLQLPASSPATLVSLFREQASLRANETALVGGGMTLSYRELDERSNQVAHFLQSRGVKTESLVAVCMDRSPLLVICMLGILKAGAAYVPLDATYPRERIAYMLADSGSEMVLTTSKYAALCSDATVDIVLADANTFENNAITTLNNDITDKQLAYVIYTSGSTGRPKGVMIEHRNVVNLVRWHIAYYEVSAVSKATAMASIGFDAFGWELWPYLCAGAATWLLDDDTRLSPETVVSLYVLAGITHSFVATGLVPEIMQALKGQQAPLQYLLTGGDRLSSVSLADVSYRLVNNYGPTENTVVTSSYTLPASGSIQPSIGKAVSNTRIYITDTSLHPVPLGVAGELCISGDQLARGYLGQPELTAEKFIPHPFRKGERLYRTGDLARWLPDGNIEFLGRKDEQVKIRGYRIELGEIENVLLQSSLVSQTIVIAAPDFRGNKRLIAYIVPAGIFDETALTAFLQGRLPGYMLPSRYIALTAMPLTANGKIDRRALPEPGDDASASGAPYTAPRNAVEATLAAIWEELMGTGNVGIHDNFFQLNGDSIISIQLVSRAKQAGIHLQVKDVFQHQTIAALSALLAERRPDNEVAGQEILNNTEYAKSEQLLSQQRYWQRVLEYQQQLPLDHKATSAAGGLKNTSARLDAALTNLLLHDVQDTYHTEVRDILLAALTRTLCSWCSSQELVIALDAGHTAAGFSTQYPVLLSIRDCTDESRLIRSIKEQLLQVPDKGIGFSVLKHIVREPAFQRESLYELAFHYAGQADSISTGQSGHLVAVNSFIKENELYINWTYNCDHFNEATIAALSSSYLDQLQLLIDHCTQLGRLGSVPTPWSYGLPAAVGYKAFEKFLESPVSADNNTSRLHAISAIYPLTPLQEGMLFHGLYDRQSAAYIEQFCCELHDLDVQALQRSWEQLLSRHTILRTGFNYEDLPVPVQCVYKTLRIPFEILDQRQLSPEQQEAAIEAYIQQDRERGFNYQEAPLMRITLIQTGERKYYMLWSFHHLLLDGWSVSLVLGELLQQYEYEVKGGTLKKAAEDKYGDYIHYIESRDKWKEQEYWRRYMEGVETATLLPFIKTSSHRNKGVGQYREQQLQLDRHTTLRITETAKRYGITVNTFMQGVWALLLHKYTGLQDIVYGVSVSGRPAGLPDVEQRAGLYINTLPLHTRFEKDREISSWLQQIQQSQVQSREYEYTSLNKIQALTGITGDLFDSLLVFDNYPVSEALKAGENTWSLKTAHVKLLEQTNFPLDILVALSKEKTAITFNYNTALLDDIYMRQLAGHFESVLLQLLGEGQLPLGSITLLTSEEAQTLKAMSAGPVVPWPADQTLASLFSQQAAASPEAVAIEFEGSALTYRELNERANQVAHYLRSKGVKENVLVPICIDRSLEMITGILGIVKAGGAYVPVDPNYPKDRIAFILEDVKASVVLSNQRCSAQLPVDGNIAVINLDEDRELARQPITSPSNIVAADHLCYVIYTSGSTGLPKGAMIEHAGMVNHLYAKLNDFRLDAATTIAFTASYTFDISVWQMFAVLICGGRTIIYAADTILSPAALITKVAEDRVNILELVPSYLTILLQQNTALELKQLRYLLVTGETVMPSLLQQWFSHPQYKHIPVVNAYGPTEASDDITHYFMHEAPDAGSIPLGKPIQNLQIQILDLVQQPCPLGVPGEIVVSGIGVGRGYLNREALTAEKFVYLTPGSDVRSYRTGDLGRWLPDGNIEYLGRIDHQVKIRGNRIELGEIESVLQQHEQVYQSVVITRQDTQGISQLIGYIVPKQAQQKEEVLAYLRERLPEYMIPLLIELDEMPLTPNGKIDRKALPEPDAGLQATAYTAPRNKTEETLADICQQLLGTSHIGINVNLFELGMHSLMVMRFAAAVLDTLQVEIPVRTFFELPTIEALAAFADEKKAAGESRKRKRIAL